jgi:hypothetical protein
MTDMTCTYPGDRDATLIAYLYDDIEPAARAAFDAHLAACGVCRDELEALGGVRAQLARWSPPEPHFAAFTNPESNQQFNPQSAIPNPQWWRAVPAWAQVAAALLFLGVSAGIANLDVHYDQNGLSVRTGWSKPAATQAAAPSNAAPWRGDLVALEQQLRSELQATAAAAAAAPAPQPARVAMSEAEVTRRFKALVDESERRQQREIALRVAEVMQNFSSQRQADLRKIDQNLGLMQKNTGVEVLRNRQMLTNFIQQVSQTR